MAGTLFRSGHPGGPGRPKGSRNKLAESFLEALHADFQEHGVAAMAAAREESPLGYVRMVASLLPQKVELNRSVDHMSDEELLAVIRAGEGGRTEERRDDGALH